MFWHRGSLDIRAQNNELQNYVGCEGFEEVKVVRVFHLKGARSENSVSLAMWVVRRRSKF